MQLDGRSLVSTLQDPKAASPHEGRSLHWQVGEGPNADWAVREGEWKLIGKTLDTSQIDNQRQLVAMFLANIQDDPGETTNLADKHPDIVTRLQKLHDEHLR